MSKPKHKSRGSSGRAGNKNAAPRRSTGFPKWRNMLLATATASLIVGAPFVLRSSTSKSGVEESPLAIPNQSSIAIITHNKNELRPRSVAELLAIPLSDLDRVDPARMHLICAEGLPGSEDLNVEACLKTLDDWAAHVKFETDRNIYHFRQNPAEYENSEGWYRMLMLNTVLQQDFGVHYDPARINDPDFRNSKDQFINGMINDPNGGTCASMPVLLTVVARRLGYPVRLVATKAHLFCRWEAPGDRVNIEGSGVGLTTYPDDYYKTWPMSITEEEIERDEYLKPFSAVDELAAYLTHRGNCLLPNKRFDEAEVAYAQAVKIKPGYQMYQAFLADAHQQKLLASGVMRMIPQSAAQPPRAFPTSPNFIYATQPLPKVSMYGKLEGDSTPPNPSNPFNQMQPRPSAPSQRGGIRP